jgi:acyl-CoA thioesterase-2
VRTGPYGLTDGRVAGGAELRRRAMMRRVPHTVRELVDLLDLERLEVDLYRGRQPDTAMQRVFGGQVAAQALRAACATVDPARRVHSLHAYFLRPGDTAIPIVYDVERVRDGGSFSTRRVVGRQSGRSIFFLTSSFARAEIGFNHQDVMPEVPSPEACPTLGELVGAATNRTADVWDREWAALDIRYAGDSRPGGRLQSPTVPARTQLWVKAAGPVPDNEVLHRCVLTYLSDLTLLGVSLVPSGVLIGTPQVQAASLDHTMWFHRPFRSDDWLLYDQYSPSASGARGFTTGRIFDRVGALVASVAQEGLIRPQGEARERLERESPDPPGG